MSDKIKDKFAVLLAGFRTSEGAPRLVIPEAGADAAAMLKSKAGAAAIEARIDALGVERKALKRLGKFMRKHGDALDVAAPGIADGAAPARKARRPRTAAKAPATAKTNAADGAKSPTRMARKTKTAAATAAVPTGRKPGRPRSVAVAVPPATVTAAEPAAAAQKPARRPYTRKAAVAKTAPAKAAAAAEAPAAAAKPARAPRARKVAPAAPAAAPSAPTARRTGTVPGRRSGRKATPTT